MHTKDMLAAELTKIGLTDMATRAATGYYHDFLSPLDTPTTQLVNDLTDAAMRGLGVSKAQVLELRKRVINGDFDASTEESSEWAASPEAQEIFGRLRDGK